MISEGSCDTEDWRNDAGNSDLITEINYILKYIPIQLILVHSYLITFHNNTVLTVFLTFTFIQIMDYAQESVQIALP